MKESELIHMRKRIDDLEKIVGLCYIKIDRIEKNGTEPEVSEPISE